MFLALGSPQRLALFERLREAADGRDGRDGELCVCDVAHGVALTLSTVCHHLKELKEAGLIMDEALKDAIKDKYGRRPASGQRKGHLLR